MRHHLTAERIHIFNHQPAFHQSSTSGEDMIQQTVLQSTSALSGNYFLGIPSNTLGCSVSLVRIVSIVDTTQIYSFFIAVDDCHWYHWVVLIFIFLVV